MPIIDSIIQSTPNISFGATLPINPNNGDTWIESNSNGERKWIRTNNQWRSETLQFNLNLESNADGRQTFYPNIGETILISKHQIYARWISTLGGQWNPNWWIQFVLMPKNYRQDSVISSNEWTSRLIRFDSFQNSEAQVKSLNLNQVFIISLPSSPTVISAIGGELAYFGGGLSFSLLSNLKVLHKIDYQIIR